MAVENFEIFNNTIAEINNSFIKPDLLKIGNNFRAVSESQIIEAIKKPFEDNDIDYNIDVKSYDVKTNEVNKKLWFIASCCVRVTFYRLGEEVGHTEAIGMGIDNCDKAIGKAYTYAVKYALLKKLRLRFSDDSDYENKYIGEEPSKDESTKENKKESKSEPLITENMTNYLEGLAVACALSYDAFKAEFGYYPNDKKIPMKTARAIIETLKKRQESLPF